MSFGIRPNLVQIQQQLMQVLLVGMTLGMMRTVVPALAESEFGVARGSFMTLVASVVAFGFVKGTMNFVAGRMAERIGRKSVLLIGWAAAAPIPLIIFFAPSWEWIVTATILLGINQGLTWSMTQTSKLDMTRPDQRGLVIGLNELAGYLGVAAAGVSTAYAAAVFGPRAGLLWFGFGVIGLATFLAIFAVIDTLPWAHDGKRPASSVDTLSAKSTLSVRSNPSTYEMFALMSWRDRRMAAICQAGLVEKFVDALVWLFWPIYLLQQGVTLPGIGWIVGIYGITWGATQLFTGKLSDKLGRHKLNVGGMWVCGAGVALLTLGNGVAWWSFCSAVTGLGMAMLYPNLSAAVADLAQPSWRASAIGIYRFWRDIGYGVGAISIGAAGALGGIESAFWLVAIVMGISGLALQCWGEETHPDFARLRGSNNQPS